MLVPVHQQFLNLGDVQVHAKTSEQEILQLHRLCDKREIINLKNNMLVYLKKRMTDLKLTVNKDEFNE